MSENNNSSNGVNGHLADSLLSPNTERAVEDIILHSTTSTNGAENNQQVMLNGNGNGNAENGGHHSVVPMDTSTSTSREDNFENLQRAVQILGRAKQLDETKNYDDALKMYRQGVDMLLEELIVRQGTDQSRTYLREKCNDFMNRIDQLKLIIQLEKETENKENSTQLQAQQ